MISNWRLPAIATCMAILQSCSSTQWQPPPPSEPIDAPNVDESKIPLESTELNTEQSVDRYVGTLPCEKCDGIRTDLRLFIDPAGEPTTFELHEVYLKTPEGDRSYTTKGRWKIFHGSPADPNAIVFEFESEPTGLMSFLLLEKKYEIRLLNRSHGELDLAIPHTLTRVDRDAVDPVVVTPEPSGKEIELKKNQLLIVRLASNPTTGFRWSLADSTDRALQLQGDADYVPDSVAPDRLGSGGTEIWRFRAFRDGDQSLQFVYRRGSEMAPTDKTISLNVKVH